MKYCRSCGNLMQDTDMVCSSCGSQAEQAVPISQDYQYAQNYQQQSKKNNSSLIFLVLALVIGGTLIYNQYFGDKGFEGKKESEINDYKYYDDNEVTIQGVEKEYGNFTFTIPTINTFQESENGLVINNLKNNYYAVIDYQDGTVYNAEKNKKTFTEKLLEANTELLIFENREYNNKNFLVIKASDSEREYYMLATQAEENKVFIITVVSLKGNVSDDVINDVATILTSAKKK